MSHYLYLCNISGVSAPDAEYLKDNTELYQDGDSRDAIDQIVQKYEALDADFVPDEEIVAIRNYLFRYDVNINGTMCRVLLFRKRIIYAYSDDYYTLTDCMKKVAERYGNQFIDSGYSPVTVGMLVTLHLAHGRDLTPQLLDKLWEESENAGFGIKNEGPVSDIDGKIIPGLFIRSM